MTKIKAQIVKLLNAHCDLGAGFYCSDGNRYFRARTHEGKLQGLLNWHPKEWVNLENVTCYDSYSNILDVIPANDATY